MKRFFVYVLLIAAAVICYFVGFGEGIVPLMAAYLVIELFLGLRLGAALRRRRRRNSQA
jgi:hypothetical protein